MKEPEPKKLKWWQWVLRFLYPEITLYLWWKKHKAEKEAKEAKPEPEPKKTIPQEAQTEPAEIPLDVCKLEPEPEPEPTEYAVQVRTGGEWETVHTGGDGTEAKRIGKELQTQGLTVRIEPQD